MLAPEFNSYNNIERSHTQASSVLRLLIMLAVSLYTLACTVVVELLQIDGLAVVSGSNWRLYGYLYIYLCLYLSARRVVRRSVSHMMTAD